MTDQTAKLSVSESVENLNGFDEELIEKLFGLPPVTYGEEQGLRGSKFLRALLFANAMREGKSETEAYRYVMGLTTKQLNDNDGLFGEDPDEVNELEPETEAGKDGSAA